MSKTPHSHAPRFVERGAQDYPSRLAAEVMGESAPQFLWMRGRLPNGSSAGVVGARRAPRDRLEAARQIARGLVARGRTVISGGAVGIDGAAHEAALDAGGQTVVVLGSGIDVVFPREHEPLFERVVAAGSAVISQFPRDFQPTRWSFPARNSVIAALSDAVIVVEAAADSGSLYTADAAFLYGKSVIALAGSPGCDALIAKGAMVARGVDDVLARIDGRPAAEPAPPSDPQAAAILAVLAATPSEVGALSAQAGLRPEQAMAALVELELAGLAARSSGGRYFRLS